MTNQKRRLYRSQTNKVIAGVCGGLGEYLNIDITVVRLVWILLTLLGGSGIIVYILAYFIIPESPLEEGEFVQQRKSDFTAARIFGILFVAIGAAILLDNLDILSFHRWWNMSWEFVLPGILILAGIYFLTKRDNIAASPLDTVQSPEEKQPKQEQAPNTTSSTGEMPKQKALRRSITDKKLFGICGGAGEYFSIDPTIIRIAYAIFTVLSAGTGIILYILLYLIIPEDQPQQNKQQ